MFATCLTCHRHLGVNQEIPTFPVGERLAFDAERGRLWVVCTHCGGWNLSPLEDRWEAIEACERLFRATRLRYSTANIGIAQLPSGLQLVRIGKALQPEIAAWRYGRHFHWPRRAGVALVSAPGRAAQLVGQAVAAVGRFVPGLRFRYDPSTWLRIHRQRDRIIDAVPLEGGSRALIRYRHLEDAELIRPSRSESWRLTVKHEQGVLVLSGAAGLRTAGKMLTALNGSSVSADQVQAAVRRLDDAGHWDDYFARMAALALRTSWGRFPDAPRNVPVLPPGSSQTEQLALYLTNRSFWGRGVIGSEPRTLLPRLPIVDRLALEMAANEDTERRALEGELVELLAAWREAEEIAAIADSLLDERSSTAGRVGTAVLRLLRGAAPA
jgi:hypothetical protein